MLFTGGDGAELTPEEEALRRCELVETFTEPLLMLPGDGDVSLEGANQGGGEGVGEQSLESQQKTNNAAEKSREKENSDNEKDNDLSNVTEEDESIDEDLIEVEEIHLFLKTFDIQAHTDEIAQLLSTTNEEGHDDMDVTNSSILTPLQEHFQTLVPETVSYTNFWSRYFYRCNPERIAREWNRHDQIEQLRQIKHQKQRERALREVSDEALSLALSAASFLKEGITGAVTELGGAVEELKMHQSKGRPLFVMDATEEDDDSYYEDDEEEAETELEWEEEDDREEEVELGWGSEDEEDDGDDETSEEDEEVNFLEVSLNEEEGQASTALRQHTPLKLESLDVVRLRRNLMHTETERNQFLQMVDERNEEICKLQSALEQHQQRLQSAASFNDQAGPGEVAELRREVEWLKQLVAARSNDSQHRDEATSEMKSIINQRRYEIAKNNRRPNKESSISESTKACKAKIQDLHSEIQALKISSCNNEQSKQASHQEELDQLKEKCNNLKLETQATNECIDRRQTQLQKLRKQQRALADEHAAFLTSPASTPSSSMSSGVKVSSDGWGEE